MLPAAHIDTRGNTNTVCADNPYRRAFIMQAHKPSMMGCKKDAKARWAVGPHCNLGSRMAAVTE